MDIRQSLRQLFEQTKELIRREKTLVHESVRLIGRLDRCNAAVNLGIPAKEFPERLGLTPDQYYKRLQAARVIERFPEFGAMLEGGRTHVAHLAQVAAKITEANSELIASRLPGMSKRELEALLSRVTPDGELIEGEGKVELRLVLSETEAKLFERAREILSAAGHVPSQAEVLVKALEQLVEARDPMRQAERSAQRAAAKSTRSATAPGQDAHDQDAHATDHKAGMSHTAPGQDADAEESAPTKSHHAPGHGSSARRPAKRPHIPAAIRHAVMLRDGGQCTEVLPDGRRCPERAMTELDHRLPYCRGGADTLDNLVLRCRSHNQAAASRLLGAHFMARHRRPSPQASP